MQGINPVSPRFNSRLSQPASPHPVQFAKKSESAAPKESVRAKLSQNTLVLAFFHLPGLRWLGELIFVSPEDRKKNPKN